MQLIDVDAIPDIEFSVCDATSANGELDAYCRGMDKVMEVVKSMPTIEVPQWTPCSERLPDKEGRYLVWAVMSFVPDHVDEPNTYQGTTIASYFERLTPFKWFGDHVEQVIAWQPLPEPYQAESEE